MRWCYIVTLVLNIVTRVPGVPGARTTICSLVDQERSARGVPALALATHRSRCKTRSNLRWFNKQKRRNFSSSWPPWPPQRGSGGPGAAGACCAGGGGGSDGPRGGRGHGGGRGGPSGAAAPGIQRGVGSCAVGRARGGVAERSSWRSVAVREGARQGVLWLGGAAALSGKQSVFCG